MQVRTCTATIESISTYSPSRMCQDEMPAGMKIAEFDKKFWRRKAHYDKAGNVIIPFMSFKKALAAAAALTKIKIAGKGNQTYSALVKSGVLLDMPLTLPLKENDLRGETFSCSSTGDSRGIGGRVPRTFPMIDDWSGVLKFYIINPEIPPDIFEGYLRQSGQFIGVGRFRPENGGVNGRFNVTKLAWA